jgi:hypothetical protein
LSHTDEEHDTLAAELAARTGESLAAFADGARTIAFETGSYASDAIGRAAAAMEEASRSRTAEEVLRLQADFMADTWRGFVGESSRLCALYADLARDISLPFEQIVAKPR